MSDIKKRPSSQSDLNENILFKKTRNDNKEESISELSAQEVPHKQVNEIDIKLTDVLGMEHAVTTLQKSVQKIIEQAPNYEELVKFMETANMEDTVKKEIFIALSRTNNVKLASKLRKFYEEGKISVFDYILNFNDEEDKDLLNSNIVLTSGSNLDILGNKSKAQYHEKPYPPPLPKIKNPVILSKVFMHKSVVNDKSYLSNVQILKSHNERLEFLGDSILNNLITLIIYEMFPNYNEGELSKLRIECVNNVTLANWSKLYDFDKELRRNISDVAFGTGKMKVYADVFEAYIGGLVSDDVSMLEIRLWLKDLAAPVINNYQDKISDQMKVPLNKNAKLELYSLIGCAAMPPRYETIQSGDGTVVPFVVACLVKDDELGRGDGQNIKEAGLRLAMASLENKPAIEKYSLIRRQMPRSLSVMRGVADSETNNGLPPLEDTIGTVATNLEEKSSTTSIPLLHRSHFNIDQSDLPLNAPVTPDHSVDFQSKGSLYALLRKHQLQPEYDLQKLENGFIKVILSVENIPFVSSVHRNGKLAGQQAAQFLLQNIDILKDFGVMD